VDKGRGGWHFGFDLAEDKANGLKYSELAKNQLAKGEKPETSG